MRLSWLRNDALVVVGLLAAITVSACDAKSAPEAAEPPIEAVSTVDVRALVLPLDPYLVDPRQERLLEQAKARLTITCLKEFGFAVEMPQALAPKVITRNERRYGLVDETGAAATGYHVPRADEAQPRQDPQLTPEALAVLRGTASGSPGGKTIPPGGCDAEARRRLGDGAAGSIDRDLAQRLSAEAHKKSEADSRVRAAFGQWSGCMKRSGFDYKDPWAANDDRVFSTESATPEEIRTAVADVRCKRETNLVATWIAVDTAYQKRFVDQHREGLTELKRLLDTELRNAAKWGG